MIGPELWDAQFWAQFWPALVATLIGAFFGVALALWANAKREQIGRKAEETALLTTLLGNLIRNASILAAVKKTLNEERGKAAPTGQVDVAFVDAIFPRLAHVCPDIVLTTWVSTARHMFHHLNRRLDHLLDVMHHPVEMEPGAIGDIIQQERLGRMATAIASNIPTIDKLLADQLLPRIATRLGVELPKPPPASAEGETKGSA